MKTKGKQLIFGFLIFLAVVGGISQIQLLSPAAADDQRLAAAAGPDQTVHGPSPVEVKLRGCESTGDIVSYKWFNQWGQLRADGACDLKIMVNFGHEDPQPGTTRSFQLVVTGTEGNTDDDWVTLTLAEASCPEPIATVSDLSVLPEESVTVRGENWEPNTSVEISLKDGPGIRTVAIASTGEGSWSQSFSAPNMPGTWWLDVESVDGDCALRQRFTFTVEAIKGDPAEGSTFTGIRMNYFKSDTRANQTIEAGILTDSGEKRWYVKSSGWYNGDTPFARVECDEGTLVGI